LNGGCKVVEIFLAKSVELKRVEILLALNHMGHIKIVFLVTIFSYLKKSLLGELNFHEKFQGVVRITKLGLMKGFFEILGFFGRTKLNKDLGIFFTKNNDFLDLSIRRKGSFYLRYVESPFFIKKGHEDNFGHLIKVQGDVLHHTHI
jgi:hypothetical protein